jgi:hypothetical protein
MSGPAPAQRLVGRQPEVRAPFISAYGGVATRPDPYNENVRFPSKPFQTSALPGTVRELLARSARPALRR